jgi:hypothetical protein
MMAGRGSSAATLAIGAAFSTPCCPLPLSALKSARPVLGNPANRNRAVPLTFDQYRFGFANTVPDESMRQHSSWKSLRIGQRGHFRRHECGLRDFGGSQSRRLLAMGVRRFTSTRSGDLASAMWSRNPVRLPIATA